MVVRNADIKIDGTVQVEYGSTFVYQNGGSVTANLR
jgi:hypothetical protein